MLAQITVQILVLNVVIIACVIGSGVTAYHNTRWLPLRQQGVITDVEISGKRQKREGDLSTRNPDDVKNGISPYDVNSGQRFEDDPNPVRSLSYVGHNDVMKVSTDRKNSELVRSCRDATVATRSPGAVPDQTTQNNGELRQSQGSTKVILDLQCEGGEKRSRNLQLEQLSKWYRHSASQQPQPVGESSVMTDQSRESREAGRVTSQQDAVEESEEESRLETTPLLPPAASRSAALDDYDAGCRAGTSKR